MARSQQNIYNQMTANYTTVMQSTFNVTVNQNIFLPANWSMYNLIGLIFWIVAGGMAIFEQIFDNYTSGIEALISVASPGTALWIQNMCINVFQYSATTPQILQFDITGTTVSPYYPTVNTALRIVTQCAVVPGIFGTTIIKVATGGSNPVPLTPGTGGQLIALQAFLNLITDPGIQIIASSNQPDKLFLMATINYNGQYSAIISSTVIAAINAYLTSIPTTGIVAPSSPVGVMRLTDLIMAVRAIPGVIDFELENVNARIDANPLVLGTYNMVSTNSAATPPTFDWEMNEWQSGLNGAGYIIPENQSGFSFTDLRIGSTTVLNLNFVAQ